MKTCQEWIDGFNLLFNNISSNKAPGMEPYEISRVLTWAEYDVVVAVFTGKLNGEPFESTEQTKALLDTLVQQQTATSPSTSDGVKLFNGLTTSVKSYLFNLKTDTQDGQRTKEILYRTVEYCILDGPCGEVFAEVVPVTQDEILRTIRNPFKRPNDRRVMRMTHSGSWTETYDDDVETLYESQHTELISKYPVKSYTVRYVQRPEPIIVSTLPSGYSIDGKSAEMTCLLPEPLHQAILLRAVQIAKSVWND